ncbi:exodeoxyribonuclease V subunit gamma [Aquisalimonas sp.]|uniref:exodeoxyribonuclease V subunit gamma n=2 Tax=Aquisalimonas TaxID=406099 RepID=UPI0025B8F37D|nr:exodeoxyribonuclease V subunit gamma [Aquisalimonas sp.]
MFYVYHHHDQIRLAELLAVLRQRQPAAPLAPDTVLVPNRSVGRWLQMELAGSEGVAANLSLPLPAKFVWGILSSSLPETPDSSAFERGNLRWHLYTLLPRIAASQPRVARYLDGTPRELRRLQLADQLADVFDQYLIYRRDMLLAWERGEGEQRSPADWQAPIWRALVDALTERHRARLLGEFIDAVEAGKPLERSRWPARIYCFGLMNLPPDYLRLLYALGREIDIHYLLPNPSEAYWGDIQRQPVSVFDTPEPGTEPGEAPITQGHPLLASLGHSARDFLRVLYADELAAIQEPELGDALAYEPPGDDTLLHRLQSGVIRMNAAATPPGCAENDASLQLHACHGPLREVQVLHDQILDRLAADDTLQPRDILVMLPDVAAYAPAIHSVFGNPDNQQRLPYTVSDQPRLSSHPIALTVSELLNLPLSRWSASEVLALAAVPAVMRRFSLDDGDLDLLRHWLQQAGVRWGLDADTRTQHGAGSWEQNTWRFGLDRLLLGLAQPRSDTLVDGVAPWPDLEGGSTAALGRLWLLVDTLRQWRDTMTEPAPADTWHQRLNAIMEALFLADRDDADERAALEAVHEAVAVLGEAHRSLGDEPLGWEAVREAVGAALQDSGERQPFLGGGITFCGLMPLRALPYRMIALLGMNDGDFPRQERNRSFNLIRRFPRTGDASVRDDDRLLFLQSLMAARDVFYVSYTGQDVRSGETLEPAPVVGELLDFLHRHHLPDHTRRAAGEQLVTTQPMQPFSPRYFSTADAAVFTFQGDWHPATLAMHETRDDPRPFVDGARLAPEPEAVIALDNLKRVLDHPARHFLRDCLRLRLERDDTTVDDDEPHTLDGLTAHQLRHELFAAACSSGEPLPPAPDPVLRARGVLPPPPLDLGIYREQMEQINPLLPLWQQWHAEHPEPTPVDVDITLPDGRRLAGRLADTRPDGLRRVRPGTLRANHRLADWIDYLALAASGAPGSLRCAGLADGAVQILGAQVEPAHALTLLQSLVDVHDQARQQPLCFMPGLATTFMEKQSPHWTSKPKDAQAALEDRNGYLGRTWYPAWELANDPWFPLVAPPPTLLGDDAGSSAFCRLATQVCGPMVETLLPVEATP